MNSENQIWSLIWSSLQEVSLQGSQRREVPSGRDETLFEASKQGNFSFFFILVKVASVCKVEIVVVNSRDMNT